jgi:putative inorganic carbon (HCO3(-)) transporter
MALGWAIVLFAIAPYVSTGIIGAVLTLGALIWLGMVLTRPLQLTPITLAVLAFWGMTTVAALCSPVLKTSLYGWSLSTLYLVGFALLSRVRRLSWVIGAYLLTVGIVGLEGLHQWRDGAAALATWVDQESPLKDTTRIYSYLGNPNLLAAYLLPAVPLGLAGVFTWQRWSARLLGGTMALLALFCIGLTYSRGGWLALGFVAVGLMILGLGRLRPMLRLGLSGGVVAILLLVITFIPSIQVRLSSIFSGRNDSSNNFRITVWETVRQMIQDHFWLGIGPGNKTFEAIYPYYQRAGFNALGAYSVPLETWVEVGFIGLIVWLWMLVTIAVWGVGLWFTLPPRQAWWCAAALLFVIGLLVQGLFDTVWYRPQVQTLWWFGVAIINSYAVANMGKPTTA